MKQSFVIGFLFLIGIFVFGTATAHADSGETGDARAYAYYGVRGTWNYMAVNAPTTCATPLPTAKNAFTYTPVEEPENNCVPSEAKPVGVGSVAGGGNVLDIKVDVGPFEEPVDVSFGFFAASFEATDIFFLNIFNQVTSLQDEFAEESALQGSFAGQGSGSVNANSKKNFKKLIPWKSNVLEVHETILGPIDVTQMSPGLYVLVLNVTRVSPADNNFDRFYRWVTFFIVPDH